MAMNIRERRSGGGSRIAMVGYEETMSVLFSTSTVSSKRVIDQKDPAGLSAGKWIGNSSRNRLNSGCQRSCSKRQGSDTSISHSGVVGGSASMGSARLFISEPPTYRSMMTFGHIWNSGNLMVMSPMLSLT